MRRMIGLLLLVVAGACLTACMPERPELPKGDGQKPPPKDGQAADQPVADMMVPDSSPDLKDIAVPDKPFDQKAPDGLLPDLPIPDSAPDLLVCSAATACIKYAKSDAGTCEPIYQKGAPCNDNNPCTHTDECDGKGVCGGTIYSCTPGQCETASVCDGAGKCTKTYKKPGTSCDDKVACTHTDMCNVYGTCEGTKYTCTPKVCESSSVCTGKADKNKKGVCSVTLKPSGTVCRAAAAADLCDKPETCNGTTSDCPPDALENGKECRAANGLCDVAEKCDGVNASCPQDAVLAKDSVCRKSAGLCDVEEKCDGVKASCPLDVLVAKDSVCRKSADACDVAEKCDGVKAKCQQDAVAAKDSVCRTSADDCDVPEKCDGSKKTCPSNAYKTKGLKCDDNNSSTLNDVCDGSGVCFDQCADKSKNGAESDVDCGGGTCSKCKYQGACIANSDCVSGKCNSGKCGSCGDLVINGTEKCDGTQLGGSTCGILNYLGGGTLSCKNDCTLDVSKCVGIFDDMEDGIVDAKKWTFVAGDNTEHGKITSLSEQNGAIGKHSSFTGNPTGTDSAYVRFKTYNSIAGSPAFDFKHPKTVLIDSLVLLQFDGSCFGSGYGEFFIIDEHGKSLSFYKYSASSSGINKEDVVIKLENSGSGTIKIYHDGVYKKSVTATGVLSSSDKWSLQFYAWVVSADSCGNSSVYMNVWIKDIRWTP